MEEGARFENPEATEIIGRSLLSSVQSQSLPHESGADETSDENTSDMIVLPQFSHCRA